MQQRPLVDPDAVRRAEVGEAWIIAAGPSLHLQVAETPYTPQPAELPTPHRDGLAVVQERPPWVVDLPDQEPSAVTVVAGELPPPRPVLPPPSPELPRLRLQLATAVREGDELALRRVLKRAARVAAHLGRRGRAGRADRRPAPTPPQPAAGLAGLVDPHRPSTEDQAMTEDEIMRRLSQAIRDDDLAAAEEMVEVGQEQHPEWDWPFLATVLWIQRSQL
jgi:hypothetical protein